MKLDDVYLVCYFQMGLHCTASVPYAILMHLSNRDRKSLNLAGVVRIQGTALLEHMSKLVVPTKQKTLRGGVHATWKTKNSRLALGMSPHYVSLHWELGLLQGKRDTPNTEVKDIFHLAQTLQHLFNRLSAWPLYRTFDYHPKHGRRLGSGLWMQLNGSHRLILNGVVCDAPDQCDAVLAGVRNSP